MSNKIKIKRGLKAGLPNLEVGEFGLATDTNEVFIGTLTGNKLVNSKNYNDLINKPTIPTKTSDLTNDSGYATETYVDNAVSPLANDADVVKLTGDQSIEGIKTFRSGVEIRNGGLRVGPRMAMNKAGDIHLYIGNKTDRLYLFSGSDRITIDGKRITGVLEGTEASDAVNKSQLDALETSKQDKLVAGTNITIDPNTNVISATGDIGGTVDWQDVENKPDLQEKLIAGDNITIENNVISASGGGGSSTAQFDTLMWNSPILTQLGIDKLVIHYAYYDKNPKNIMVTLDVGMPIEVPLPVFASYTFAQFSTQFAGAVITNITEVSPDYEFVVFTEDINRINPSTDFLRVFDFNSTCRMIEDEGVSGYVISYRASSSQIIFDYFGEPGINTLSVGFMAVFEGATIEDTPMLTEIDVGGGNTYTRDEIDLMVGDIESALDAILGV